MAVNIFGRDSDDDKKYHDLFQSVMRIVDKSKRKDIEKDHSFQEITGNDPSLVNVQQTYKETIQKKLLSE